MAQNLTIAGAAYSAVPAVDIPKTGGGTARFVDTSDANAYSGKIASGYSGYVNGIKVEGTLVKRNATTVIPGDHEILLVPAFSYTEGDISVAAVQTETKTVTSNGTVTPTPGKYLSSVTVAIPVYDGSVS